MPRNLRDAVAQIYGGGDHGTGAGSRGMTRMDWRSCCFTIENAPTRLWGRSVIGGVSPLSYGAMSPPVS